MDAWLSEPAIRRVLQSLISTTVRRLAPGRSISRSSWSDSFSMGEGVHESLGCDSLDRLQIATAINEMFHLHEASLEAGLLQAETFGQIVNLVQQAWKDGVSRVSVSTSGSTGVPKFCIHSWEDLALEIDCIAACFHDRQRIVAYTPSHHLYGLLFTAMLPDRLSVPVYDLQASEVSGFNLQDGDLVVSFPDGWSWIDANIRTAPLRVKGVVSTAPCPRALIDSLTSTRFSAFTEVYGSSETAGIGMRQWPEFSYTLMPHWQRIGDDKQSRLMHSKGFVVDAMDSLAFTDSTHFSVLERFDGAVQVAGTNVFPTLLADRLLTFPGVAYAAVRLMLPSEGQRLKCFIVPEANVNTTELHVGLTRWIETWDVTAERPKHIRIGEDLPKSFLGKMIDW